MEDAMKRKLTKRIFSVVTALAVFAALPLAFTQNAYAASKEKTFYVPVSYDYINDGYPSYSAKYIYDDNGLLKEIKDTNGRRVFSRNSKGYLTGMAEYSDDYDKGPVSKYVFKYKFNKRGLPVTEKNYEQRKTKKILRSTRTFTYYANRNVKKMVLKRPDGKYYEIHKFRKNGTPKSSYYKSSYPNYSGYESVTYDKHGNMLTYKTGAGSFRHHLKYDKRGNLIKDECTDLERVKRTETYKYTYDKHNNILKCVFKARGKGPGESYTENTVDKYTYEPVRSKKPYWHFFSKNDLFYWEEYL